MLKDSKCPLRFEPVAFMSTLGRLKPDAESKCVSIDVPLLCMPSTIIANLVSVGFFTLETENDKTVLL